MAHGDTRTRPRRVRLSGQVFVLSLSLSHRHRRAVTRHHRANARPEPRAEGGGTTKLNECETVKHFALDPFMMINNVFYLLYFILFVLKYFYLYM